jgi:hypothetical protein
MLRGDGTNINYSLSRELKRKLRISPTGLTTPLASSSNVREENIIMR